MKNKFFTRQFVPEGPKLPDNEKGMVINMEDSKTVILCTVNDKIQAEMMMDVLEQNGIHAYREGVGSAGIMDIYGGNSTFGEKIYVNENDLSQAKNLMESFLI